MITVKTKGGTGKLVYPAVQLTRESFEEAKDFAGEAVKSSYMTHKEGPEMWVELDTGTGVLTESGDWLIKIDGKIERRTDKSFNEQFERV